MSVTLSKEIRARLDAHLDAVDAALATTENSRERRRGIVDDLESQIIEMLEARSPNPTVSDLEAILKQLDPPSAYAGDMPPVADKHPPFMPVTATVIPQQIAPRYPQQIAPRYSRTAIAGLVCIILSMFPPLLIFHDPTGESSSLAFALLGTILGWVSIHQISHSKGTLRGIYLALFDAYFFIVIMAVLFFICLLVVALFSHPTK